MTEAYIYDHVRCATGRKKTCRFIDAREIY